MLRQEPNYASFGTGRALAKARYILHEISIAVTGLPPSLTGLKSGDLTRLSICNGVAAYRTARLGTVMAFQKHEHPRSDSLPAIYLPLKIPLRLRKAGRSIPRRHALHWMGSHSEFRSTRLFTQMGGVISAGRPRCFAFFIRAGGCLDARTKS